MKRSGIEYFGRLQQEIVLLQYHIKSNPFVPTHLMHLSQMSYDETKKKENNSEWIRNYKKELKLSTEKKGKQSFSKKGWGGWGRRSQGKVCSSETLKRLKRHINMDPTEFCCKTHSAPPLSGCLRACVLYTCFGLLT